MLDENSLIPCKLSPSVRLKIGEDSSVFNSGCSIIEVNFPTTKGCQVGFIKFKNNYVASVSARAKFKDEGGQYMWKMVLKDYILMQSPHHEQGGQDYFIIDCQKEFSYQPENIVMMRLILRQPSPHWLRFDLDDLAFHLPCEKLEITKSSKPINEEGCDDSNSTKHEDEREQIAQCDLEYQELFSKVTKIVNLAKDKTVRSALKESASGRFDIDGKYDLNLLSYT